MRSLNEYSCYLDFTGAQFLLIKAKPKNEFIKTVGSEEQYNIVQKSKVGYIKLYKISDNPGIEKNKEYSGITVDFGEGLGVRVTSPSHWFNSSVIQSIDWENKTFKTLNSTYAFEFEELDPTSVIDKILNSRIDVAGQNSKQIK